MNPKPVIAIALILFALLGFGLANIPTGGITQKPGQANGYETAIVTRVIDGDTVVIEGDERIRLLGIDTPERGQHFYQEAKQMLQEMVENKTVMLESDIKNRDKYNRLLRYIYAGETLVNLELVKKGMARAYIIPPNERHSDEILMAEAEARNSNLGIWKFSGLKDIFCIGIFYFHYNARGNDNENLNDEYVVFRNSCNHSLNLGGWVIKDAANKSYAFPDFPVPAKTKFILHTGSGTDNETDLYWESSRAIWNNNGDTLRMWNSEGELLLDYSYGQHL